MKKQQETLNKQRRKLQHQIPETDRHDGTNGQSGLERFLQNMRADQNVALASERWHEASENQHAIVAALDASAGPEGLTMEVTNRIRNVFQRLYRYRRNRGHDDRRDRFRLYVENMDSLMR